MDTYSLEIAALAVNACSFGLLIGSSKYKTHRFLFAVSTVSTICSAIGLVMRGRN